MYSKPSIFKGYSIVILIFAFFNLISSIFYVIKAGDFANKIFRLLSFSGGSAVTIFIQILLILIAFFGFFFSYIDFSSMFTFSKMIEYEQSNNILPMEKIGCAFSPNVYRKFGTVIFSVNLAVTTILAIIEIIADSITNKFFICIPVLSLAIYALELFLIYIVYFVRYKTFGDLYEIVTTKEPSSKLIQDIKNINPNLLRGFCVFLFVIDVLLSIGAIVLLCIFSSAIISALGGTLGGIIIASIILSTIILVLCIAVIGCYFDGLAKMLEHYLIKFRNKNV